MPPALLAGPWGLFVSSSKLLEVQSGVSAQLGCQAINQSSLEQQDATGREQEAGDLGSSPVGIALPGCLWPRFPDDTMCTKLTYILTSNGAK